MSQFTPESIKSQITAYDTIVREAVRTGNLSRVAELEDQIVSNLCCCFKLLNRFLFHSENILQNLYALYRPGTSSRVQSSLVLTRILERLQEEKGRGEFSRGPMTSIEKI